MDEWQTSQMLDRFADMVQRGGPHPSEYALISETYRQLYAAGVRPQQVAAVYEPTLKPACLHGYAYLKPHGYAGDFVVIDRIYTGWLSPNPILVRHDEYFQGHAAPRAVRNRKAYFQRLMLHIAQTVTERPLKVLNIASGPGRDVYELFAESPDAPLCIHCVDADPDALEYAARLCAPFAHQVTFERANALRLRPQEKYDLIWSAGLFDYLADDWFAALTQRFLAHVQPQGELVIGNFSPANPTRAAMELLCEWHLHHRSPGDLRRLAAAAGATGSAIRIDQEPEGVNLFLHIRPAELRA